MFKQTRNYQICLTLLNLQVFHVSLQSHIYCFEDKNKKRKDNFDGVELGPCVYLTVSGVATIVEC